MSDAEIARRNFMPMSFSLTVGPGSIAAAITHGVRHPRPARGRGRRVAAASIRTTHLGLCRCLARARRCGQSRPELHDSEVRDDAAARSMVLSRTRWPCRGHARRTRQQQGNVPPQPV
jgi:hypothetical protein